MKPLLQLASIALLGTASLAQQTSRQYTTYVYDLNGRRVEVGRTTASSTPQATFRAVLRGSINGREVPFESVEERVLSEDAAGRVVERIVTSYDQTGRPGPPEKLRIVERKTPDGGTRVETSVYRGDINGGFRLSERSTTESSKSGDVLRSQTVVERPGLSGAWELAEKRLVVSTDKPDGSQRDAIIYRKDESGRLYQAAREISERVTQDDRQTETTTEYNTAVTGRLEFAGRTVTNVQKQPDGSETKLVEIYGAASLGRTAEGYAGGPQLREQQLIERKMGPGGSVVETFSMRRTDLADSDRLGAFRKISEVVCTGDCNTEKSGK